MPQDGPIGQGQGAAMNASQGMAPHDRPRCCRAVTVREVPVPSEGSCKVTVPQGRRR